MPCCFITRRRQFCRAGIVHRLDKDTSGLMVIALSQTAQIKLAEQSVNIMLFENTGCCRRTYHGQEGTIDGGIARDPANRLVWL